MLTFSGFNGFGQFGSGNELRVAQRREVKLEDIDTKQIELVSAAWSYTAFVSGKQLLLKGFLLGKSNASLRMESPDTIIQIAAGDKICLILLESGKILKISPAMGDKLQEIKFASLDETDDKKRVQKRSIFGELRQTTEVFKITHIACGSNIACAISNTNAVYNIPSKIYQLPKHLRVQQLVCGNEHALLLTKNGDIYSWGNGLRGQLGHDVMGIMNNPLLIDALAGVKITNIAAGGWHSAAISTFGDLYTWGFNPNGQLGLRVFKCDNGLKNPTVYPLPQLIDLPLCCGSRISNDVDELVDGCTPLQVFAGFRHTIVKMSCGALFSTGWNAHSQFGFDCKVSFYDTFSRIDNSTEHSETNVTVICGAWCTIFKIS